jgi:hypothetical protein
MKQNIENVYISSFKTTILKFKSELGKIGVNIGISTQHIMERSKQRHLSVDLVFDILHSVYKKRLCELVYAMCIGKHSRIEIRHKDLILVVSRSFRDESTTWVFSTVLDPKKHSLNKYDAPPEGVYHLIF